ncbi:unnamed protein product [Cochlearia groenlandica]
MGPGPGGPGPGGPGWGPGPGGPGWGPGRPDLWPPVGGFFSGFSNMICSCLSCVCCCWLLRDCFGGPPPQAPPLLPSYY